MVQNKRGIEVLFNEMKGPWYTPAPCIVLSIPSILTHGSMSQVVRAAGAGATGWGPQEARAVVSAEQADRQRGGGGGAEPGQRRRGGGHQDGAAHRLQELGAGGGAGAQSSLAFYH